MRAGVALVLASCVRQQLERVLLSASATELSEENERRAVVRLPPVQRTGVLVLRGLHV